MPLRFRDQLLMTSVIWVFFSPNTFATEPEMDRLGKAFGGYFYAGYMLTALKNSECGYAYKVNPVDGIARLRELMSLLKDDAREKVRRELTPDEISKIENDATNEVRNDIIKMKQKYDKNTACGLYVGLSVGVTQKYEDIWRQYLKSGSKVLK
jgi:hypothetical protein